MHLLYSHSVASQKLSSRRDHVHARFTDTDMFMDTVMTMVTSTDTDTIMFTVTDMATLPSPLLHHIVSQ